jgi:hypothetical protein
MSSQRTTRKFFDSKDELDEFMKKESIPGSKYIVIS